jgi:phosphohistidine phosphatase
MKHIILMRHAKSDSSDRTLTDHQRNLTLRGNHDARVMAERLKEYGILPDLMLVSDAIRARDTWQIIFNLLGKSQTKFDTYLYMASPRTIIKKLKEVDNLIETVLVLAHNPGITEVFQTLANVQIDYVPSGGVVCIQLHTDKFSEIDNCTKDLIYFTYPKV